MPARSAANLRASLALSPTEPVATEKLRADTGTSTGLPREGPRFFLPDDRRSESQSRSPTPSPETDVYNPQGRAGETRRHLRTQSEAVPGSSRPSADAMMPVTSRDSSFGYHLSRREEHHRHRSRASIAALRSALQLYQVHSPDDPLVHLHTRHSSDEPRGGGTTPPRTATETSESRTQSHLGMIKMDALVEIHRVLYRGKEDLEREHRILGWREQTGEVKRVVERWFEGDCVYDHPLVRHTSRDSLLLHFALIHFASTLYVPAVTPSGILVHMTKLGESIRNKLFGAELERDTEEDQAAKSRYSEKTITSDSGLEEEWLGLSSTLTGRHTVHTAQANSPDNEEGWWKLWDVRADCREIGEMECYDGYHLALIEHVMTLTLLPSLRPPPSPTFSTPPLPGSVPPSIKHHRPTAMPPAGRLSLPRRLMEAMMREFEDTFSWELPITTSVQFNEVGKATHVRDVIDVRDAIETFVPFAKRLGRLTRHITGMVTSALGGLILSRIQAGPVDHRELDSTVDKRYMVPLMNPIVPTKTSPPCETKRCLGQEPNTLGLQGVPISPRSRITAPTDLHTGQVAQPISGGGAAPDVDLDGDMDVDPVM
ncbi:hypothetical protein IAU60_002510 [Kwoniella sp. DSM 27419]